MDHRQFVNSLTTEQRKALTAKSNAKGLRALFFHLSALAVSTFCIVNELPAWGLALLPQGILMVFLFTTLHETIHNTAFSSRSLNTVVARFCSLVLLLPKEWFTHFHLAHHRHTQDPNKDPELALEKPDTPLAYWWHVSGIPVTMSTLRTLTSNALGKTQAAYIPSKREKAVQTEAIYMVLFYLSLCVLSVITRSTHLLWAWVIPLLIGQPFLRLYLLAEHGHCPTVANQFDNTRTTFTHGLVKKLAWNMPYHTEHHVYPAVPFHQLPALHRLTQEYLVNTATSYRDFNQQYRANLGTRSTRHHQ